MGAPLPAENLAFRNGHLVALTPLTGTRFGDEPVAEADNIPRDLYVDIRVRAVRDVEFALRRTSAQHSHACNQDYD